MKFDHLCELDRAIVKLMVAALQAHISTPVTVGNLEDFDLPNYRSHMVRNVGLKAGYPVGSFSVKGQDYWVGLANTQSSFRIGRNLKDVGALQPADMLIEDWFQLVVKQFDTETQTAIAEGAAAYQ